MRVAEVPEDYSPRYADMYFDNSSAGYTFGTGMSAFVVLFYHMISSVQYEVSMIWLLCLNLICLNLIVFASHCTNRTFIRLSYIIINCDTRIFQEINVLPMNKQV